MSRNESCVCGSGKKQKRCHPDITPDSRAGNLLKKYRDLDNRIAEFYENAGERPPCHKGCVSCCYHVFSITGMEYKLIERELKRWSQRELEQLRDIVNGQWETLKEVHPEFCESLKKDGTGDRRPFIEQTMLGRNTYGLPCPLLDTETGACRVYRSRPMMCRLHGVTHYTFDEFEVCELIPSNTENIAITVDATDYGKQLVDLSNFETHGMQFRTRPYPILYWLLLTFRAYNGTIRIPYETRDFRTPAVTANEMEFQKYASKR